MSQVGYLIFLTILPIPHKETEQSQFHLTFVKLVIRLFPATDDKMFCKNDAKFWNEALKKRRSINLKISDELLPK